jgi:hypothetical protein
MIVVEASHPHDESQILIFTFSALYEMRHMLYGIKIFYVVLDSLAPSL